MSASLDKAKALAEEAIEAATGCHDARIYLDDCEDKIGKLVSELQEFEFAVEDERDEAWQPPSWEPDHDGPVLAWLESKTWALAACDEGDWSTSDGLRLPSKVLRWRELDKPRLDEAIERVKG